MEFVCLFVRVHVCFQGSGSNTYLATVLVNVKNNCLSIFSLNGLSKIN